MAGPPLNRHPFFRPLWRRLVVVAVCAGWAAFEFIGGSPAWGMIFGGLGAYAAWNLLLRWEGGAS